MRVPILSWLVVLLGSGLVGCGGNETTQPGVAGTGGTLEGGLGDQSSEKVLESGDTLLATDPLSESETEIAPEASFDANGCVAKSCAQVGASCGIALDGCNHTINCGSCPSAQVCGAAAPNTCGAGNCAPKTCTQLNASCGLVSDKCADVLDCGGCPGSQTCGGKGVPNQCGCTPYTCASLGANCGEVPDGCDGKLSCGACPSEEICGGGGTNRCGAQECAPKTCAQLNAACGLVSDGCKATVYCGDCAAPQTCGGGGIPNQCGCAPDTCDKLNAECGTLPNGCGGTLNCGTCGGGVACDANNHCACECQVPHAVTSCSAGVCTIKSCEAGWADCDADSSNGCEISITTSVDNCGQCGKACSHNHVSQPSCAGGLCVPTCENGYKDCNGPVPASVDDGCEGPASEMLVPGGCTNSIDDDCDGGQDCGGDSDCDNQAGPQTPWGAGTVCYATPPVCDPDISCDPPVYSDGKTLFCRKMEGVVGWYQTYDPVNPGACATECFFGCCRDHNVWCRNGVWTEEPPTTTECPSINSSWMCATGS